MRGRGWVLGKRRWQRRWGWSSPRWQRWWKSTPGRWAELWIKLIKFKWTIHIYHNSLHCIGPNSAWSLFFVPFAFEGSGLVTVECWPTTGCFPMKITTHCTITSYVTLPTRTCQIGSPDNQQSICTKGWMSNWGGGGEMFDLRSKASLLVTKEIVTIKLQQDLDL